MTAWLADENFNDDVLRGVARRVEMFDCTTVEEQGIRSAPDPQILELAAAQGRVLLTHDVDTMPKFAYERLIEGLPMPGVLLVTWTMPIGRAIDGLVLAVEAGVPSDFDGLVTHLPQ